jgi:hypothetical protein
MCRPSVIPSSSGQTGDICQQQQQIYQQHQLLGQQLQQQFGQQLQQQQQQWAMQVMTDSLLGPHTRPQAQLAGGDAVWPGVPSAGTQVLPPSQTVPMLPPLQSQPQHAQQRLPPMLPLPSQLVEQGIGDGTQLQVGPTLQLTSQPAGVIKQHMDGDQGTPPPPATQVVLTPQQQSWTAGAAVFQGQGSRSGLRVSAGGWDTR